jgi:Zn ribbon nucleic-acid-binding protein
MTGTLTRPELTASDRCDRCGAAATMRAVLPSGGELLFCGHHARQHQVRLRELDAELSDGG